MNRVFKVTKPAIIEHAKEFLAKSEKTVRDEALLKVNLEITVRNGEALEVNADISGDYELHLKNENPYILFKII